MTHIVFLDRDTLPSRITINRPNFPHTWQEFNETPPKLTIERCRNADIVITNKVFIGENVFAACPNLKHIAVAATGINNIDLNASHNHQVSVSNIRSYATTSVPEHVISMALTLRRNLLQYRQYVIQGEWQRSTHFCVFGQPIKDLALSTMGIIGFGELGQATAQLANALGMRVIFHSPSDKHSDFAKQVTLDTLLKESDIISCHCPLNDITNNLIGIKELEKMQTHAILINTARGGIINENALVKAIEQQKIGGVGIDVLLEEPPTINSPLMRIADNPNVIITPHIAWASDTAMQTLANQLIDNINAFLDNKPQNLVA